MTEYMPNKRVACRCVKQWYGSMCSYGMIAACELGSWHVRMPGQQHRHSQKPC